MPDDSRCKCTCGMTVARRESDGTVILHCRHCKREWTVEALIAEHEKRKARRDLTTKGESATR